MADATERLNAALEGRYAIERELGEGGMATVYLADDLKHERKVALKVLKPELAAVVGAERFLGEIKTTANLQHPHILPLHDSGEADGFLFYVMPYVEGETLRERLDREHQLPVDEAVKITTDLAEALDYAHRHKIIHRDIKPANILLHEGRPLIADFGIALAVGAAGGGRLTETGLSLGTPFYMSPEQATGDQFVGSATDTYALGAVLYEMLTGDPPYMGSTAQAVLGQIIAGEAVSATKKRGSVPANVDAALRCALEKLPADRFTSTQDFVRALGDEHFRYGELVTAGGSAPVGPWNRLTMAFAALASLLAVAFGWSLLRPQQPRPVGRFELSFSEGQELVPGNGINVALSPDGSRLVYAGQGQLWQRRLNQLEPEPIPGTEGVRNAVFSPDGTSLAFNGDGSLRTVSLLGGPSSTVVASGVPAGTGGLDWGSDGMLYFTNGEGAIQRVPASGGEPEPVTANDAGTRHQFVDALPEGRGLLFTIRRGGLEESEIAVMGFDEREVRTLLPGTMGRYASSGHIVYAAADSTLLAAPFDLGRLEVTGPSVGLLENVSIGFNSPSRFALSETGTLIYASGGAGQGGWSLVWVDRDGREQPLGLEPQPYFYPRVSPDGGRLAVAVFEGDTDLWVFDLDRGSRSRITFGGTNQFFPVWTPAGDQLAFSDAPLGTNTLHLVAADGSGQIDTLLQREGVQFPTSWSRDGSLLAYHETHPETLRDLWVLPVGGDPEPFLITPFQERAPAFSPDGRWLAYVSNESGQDEIYVQPYPGPGPEFTVSTAGGREPVWSPDGSELFYRTEDQLMVVAVEPGDTFRGDTPRPLFADPYQRDNSAANGAPNYDIMPDGQRFVMVSANVQGTGEGLALILVTNWFEELRQRVPN